MGFCGEDKKYTDKPQWFDPLGPSKGGRHKPTGAPEMRNDIFNSLKTDVTPRGNALVGDAIGAAQQAANHPGFDDAANLATRTIRGDFLNSNPYLDKALDSSRNRLETGLTGVRRKSMADLAGAQAGARSNFARSGLSYSTAQTQGDQANKAAMLAGLGGAESDARAAMEATDAQSRLANYQSERGAQERAPAMLEMATGTPLNYLSALPQLNALPAQQAAQIIQGLAGNGQIATPQSTITRQPGVVDYALGFTSAIGQAA
jgi:hypothetical protein